MTTQRRVRSLTVGVAVSTVLGFAGSSFAAAGEGVTLIPLVTALHVHSKASTGDLTLDELAEQAERRGLDAVMLTENLVLRYEYGLFPLRGVIKRTVALPSVLDYGLERFFADVAAAQARHPRVLLVPGAEVTPHYFWTGSLGERNLTMHNSQKNILVFGLSDAGDYAALPVPGSPASYRFGWRALLNLTPGLLFIPAVWLWCLKTYRTTRVGVTPYRIAKRHRVPALTLAAVGILSLVNAWPFSEPVFGIYEDGLGYRPYQSFVETVAARGGVTVWSMPEARDFNEFPYGPLGTVTVKTDPYPEALVLTTGYTAFGGVYQDTRTVTVPGGLWDQVLELYLVRQRAVPSFAVGEVAFHGLNRDTRELDQVVTVFWVRERSAAGIFEAMRAGRLYAVGQYSLGLGLRLETFQVECAGGAQKAGPGEPLEPNGVRDITVRLSISATDHGSHPVSVTVIRSGQVVAKLSGVTPFEQRIADAAVPPGVWNFYRVAVEGQGGEILSNPIFVGPVPAESGSLQHSAVSPQP